MTLDWIIPVAFVLIYTGLAEEMRHMSEPIAFNASRSYCSSLGNSYSLVDDTVGSEILNEYMGKQSLISVWLGIERRTLPDWKWVDGRKLTLTIPNGDHGARACGGVSTVAGSLRAMACNYGGDHEGVVCEHEYNSKDTWSPDHNFYKNGKIFTFQCGVKNWYEARDICKTNNATIAILDNHDKLNAFVNAKMKVPSMALCGFFWIGLRREEWYSVNGRVISETNWDNGEPAILGTCAVARELKWTVVACEQKNTAVCVSFSPTQKINFRNTIRQTSTFRTTSDLPKLKVNGTIVDSSEKGTWLLLVTLAIVLGITLLTGIVILVFCHRYRQKNKSRRKTSVNKNDQRQEEQHKLMEMGPKREEREDLGDHKEKTSETPVMPKSKSLNARMGITDKQNNQREITPDVENQPRRRNSNISIEPLRSRISNFSGVIKIYVIFKRENVFKLQRVMVKPFYQKQKTQSADRQCEGMTQPLLNTNCDEPVLMGIQSVSLFNQFRVEKCDILVIETTADDAQTLISTHSHYLKDMCVLLSAAQIDRNRIDGTIIVKEVERSNSSANNIDIFVNSRICYENLIVPLEDKPNERYAATWYTANLVALIFMLGKEMGLTTKRYQRLRQTENILKVLKEMKYSGKKDSQMIESIYPWTVLRKRDDIENAIDRAVTRDTDDRTTTRTPSIEAGNLFPQHEKP